MCCVRLSHRLFNYLLQTIGTSVVCDALFVLELMSCLVKMTDCSFDEYILSLSLCSWVWFCLAELL